MNNKLNIDYVSILGFMAIISIAVFGVYALLTLINIKPTENKQVNIQQSTDHEALKCFSIALYNHTDYTSCKTLLDNKK